MLYLKSLLFCYFKYILNLNFVICLQGNKWCNNSHTSSTHIDLYDIPYIFYTRIIHTHCLWMQTGYHKYTDYLKHNMYTDKPKDTHTHIYIYIKWNITLYALRDQNICNKLLFTIPININDYVSFLINTLDTIVRGWLICWFNITPLAAVTFFMLLVSIVFC